MTSEDDVVALRASLDRQAEKIIGDLWKWHSDVCECRAKDGARCDRSRLIAGVARDLRALARTA